MPDQLKKFADPLKARWDLLSMPQRYKLVGVICVVVVAIVITLFFALRVRYETLAANRDMLEIMGMQSALNQAGIRNRTDNNGRDLLVDARRMQEAAQTVWVANAAPADDRFTWANALDTGLGTTDLERRRMHQLALEDSIADMIVGMMGVTHASVNLDLPHRRPFDTNAPMPSAIIAITTTRDIAQHEARTIARAAAFSISDLELDNIAVIDQNMRTLFDGSRDVIEPDSVTGALEARNQHRNQALWTLTRQFLHMFDNVEAGVNFVFDDTLFTEEIAEVWRRPEGGETGIPFERRDVRAEVENVPGGVEPGFAAQLPVTPGYAMGPGGVTHASTREQDVRYQIDNITTITQRAPGWVIPESSSASIMATIITNIRQDLWMSDVPEGEVRTTEDWERFKQENSRSINITNQFDAFDDVLLMAAATTGIPAGNIHLMIWEDLNFIDDIPTAWDIPLLAMFAVLLFLLALLALGVLQKAKTAAAASEEAEPELSVEDLLVSTQLEEAKEEAAEEFEAIDYFKENEIKKHIEKFVNEKPEAVASLLRNWINAEEW